MADDQPALKIIKKQSFQPMVVFAPAVTKYRKQYFQSHKSTDLDSKLAREQFWERGLLNMKNISERRDTERFDLKVPAIVRQLSGSNVKNDHLLLTRDISSKGAYFNSTGEQIYEGPVEVEVLLKAPGDEAEDNYIYMKTCGEIVRHDATGLAVKFSKESTLKPFYT